MFYNTEQDAKRNSHVCVRPNFNTYYTKNELLMHVHIGFSHLNTVPNWYEKRHFH